jgi:hypothetical protein
VRSREPIVQGPDTPGECEPLCSKRAENKPHDTVKGGCMGNVGFARLSVRNGGHMCSMESFVREPPRTVNQRAESCWAEAFDEETIAYPLAARHHLVRRQRTMRRRRAL